MLCLNYSLLLESASFLSLLFLFRLCMLVGFRRQADSNSNWVESSALRSHGNMPLIIFANLGTFMFSF